MCRRSRSEWSLPSDASPLLAAVIRWDKPAKRLSDTPDQWLVDRGFPAHEQIDAVAGKTELYAPVPKSKSPKSKDAAKGDANPAGETDPAPQPPSEFEPKPGDGEAVAQRRQRMHSDAAREIYKQRAATAECVNAQARNRGLQRMPVRGLAKVKCVVRLFVLAHNLLRMAAPYARIGRLGHRCVRSGRNARVKGRKSAPKPRQAPRECACRTGMAPQRRVSPP
jgi:hypothetical protein